jgi:GNAT superfamily N-acetyltransferase
MIAVAFHAVRHSALRIRRVTQSETDSYRSLLTCNESRGSLLSLLPHSQQLRTVERRAVCRAAARCDWVHRGETIKRSKVVGAAHAFLSLNSAEAEIAVLVASDARRRDVGHALLERLIEELRARDYLVVSAYSLAGNNAFSHIARSVGMEPIGPPSDVTTWTLSDVAA